MYVINKEICVRTVCAHEELLRGKSVTRREPLDWKAPSCPTLHHSLNTAAKGMWLQSRIGARPAVSPLEGVWQSLEELAWAGCMLSV